MKEFLQRSLGFKVGEMTIAAAGLAAAACGGTGTTEDPALDNKDQNSSSNSQNLEKLQGSVDLGFPWVDNDPWYLTSGPHFDGLSMGIKYSLDFAPPVPVSCPGNPPNTGRYVTSAARGEVIVRGDETNLKDPNHSIIEIRHEDGSITGYMHLANIRVNKGDRVNAGVALGNPSCEVPQGGETSGQHVHFYLKDVNGNPIPIKQKMINGWLAVEDAINRNGLLEKPGEETRTADAGRCGPSAASIKVCGGIRNDLGGDASFEPPTSVPPTATSTRTPILPSPGPKPEAATATPTPKEKPGLKILNRVSFETKAVKVGKLDVSEIAVSAEIPSSVPVYEGAPAEDYTLRTSYFAQKLGFAGVKPVEGEDIYSGRVFLYSNSNGALGVYTKTVTGAFKEIPGFSAGEFTDTAQLKNVALSFFTSIEVAHDLSPEYKVTYRKTAYEYSIKTKNIEEATIVDINFSYKLDGLNVFYPKGELYATFDKSGKLFSFGFSSVGVGTHIENYPVISVQQAQKILSAGNASLVMLDGDLYYGYTADTFDLIKINKAYLAYYATNPAAETLQPVWIFEGRGVSTGPTVASYDIYYAVPAIDPKYLR